MKRHRAPEWDPGHVATSGTAKMVDRNQPARARAAEVAGKLRARQLRRIELVRILLEATGGRWPFRDGAHLELVEQRPPRHRAVGAALAGKPAPPTLMVVREVRRR